MPLLQDDSSSPRPLEIAAIDLGSNSFHMIIARVVNGALTGSKSFKTTGISCRWS